MAEKIRDRFELKFIFLLLALLFGLFLILPVLTIAFQSLGGDTGISSSFYSNIFAKANFISALKNAFQSRRLQEFSQHFLHLYWPILSITRT